MTRFLDGGDGRTCDEMKNEMLQVCDLCQQGQRTTINTQTRCSDSVHVPAAESQIQSHPAPVYTGRQAVERRISSHSSGRQRLETLINAIGSAPGKSCPVCFLLGRETGANEHSFDSCTVLSSMGKPEVARFTRKIKWPANYGICWPCGLWEGICGDNWHGERAPCPHRDVLVPAVMMTQYVQGSIRLRTLELAG